MNQSTKWQYTIRERRYRSISRMDRSSTRISASTPCSRFVDRAWPCMIRGVLCLDTHTKWGLHHEPAAAVPATIIRRTTPTREGCILHFLLLQRALFLLWLLIPCACVEQVLTFGRRKHLLFNLSIALRRVECIYPSLNLYCHTEH